ncbi:hypothetical protein [Aromatoleum bremense]|uniref:Uncharacterized protein n=1 Tax=Aromatoleum bremense TaxID=76115 RepID=A0ABX1P260_9RHOO|nr:hypothetical protein [Aromatoleum bremense]NMG17780.1 hypothetical protein [Aromatoleum bremense]QTQ33013.1 Uncharacterized protein pbN1_30250 [Aromatoleum bremense]
MTPYLPKYATIEQACDWLEHETGESWILARLLECHLKPWIWIDYKPGWPDIFGSRLEGYLAPMVFAGDTQRMEADGTDALVTMTRTHDGKLLKIEPGWRVPLSEIRFKREDIQRVLEIVSASSARHVNASAAHEEATPAPPAPEDAQEPSGAPDPWIVRAREYAADIWLRELGNNKRPTKEGIAPEIAGRLWRGKMVTRRRARITADYIVSHALNPKRNGGWEPPLPD